MPQAQLPLFADGMTPINAVLAFERREAKVYYFNGHLPVFVHADADVNSFRFMTTQLIINGTASQGEIARAFHVPLVTVKRCVKRYREHGAEGFFRPSKRRTGCRLNPEVLSRAQALLDEAWSVPSIAQELGVLASTLHKAIDDGRLRWSREQKKSPPAKQAAPSGARPARASAG